MELLTVLLFCLATYRFTRFITYDHFPMVAVPRMYITNWLDPTPDWIAGNEVLEIKAHPDAKSHGGWFGRALSFLIECDWCMSAWVAIGLWFAAAPFMSVPLPGLLIPTASAVTGWLAMHDGRD